jgi:catechol 2,3-dioxygenase-like lactoylglutathione lyase family enzyme
MSLLQSAAAIAIVCTASPERATAFYRDTLGLRVTGRDDWAVVFDLGGIALRLSTVPGFTAGPHPVLGLRVPDVRATVVAMRAAGVNCIVYPGMGQDELGIWTAPGTNVHVAFFADPDGNVLSLTDG